MSETKWTRGPWPLKPTGDHKRILVGDGLVEGPNGYEVAEVYSDDCAHEEAWGNANLIAAAPDLYDSIDPDTLDAIADEIGGEFKHTARAGSLRGIAKRQRAAMLKARGETP